MEAFLLYIAKVAVSISAFFLMYLLLFSKLKQFRYNRIYLTSSFVLSMLIPLITITITRTDVNQLVLLPVRAATDTTVVTTDSGTGILLTFIMMMVYLSGIVLFLAHLVTGHFRVRQIARKSHPGSFNGIRVFVTAEDVHPFTFFGKIIVPRESTSQSYFPMILTHEKIHADGHHTLDILMSEILFLFQWFNPFAWLLKDAIKNNLEYLTDQEVTRQADLPSYQMALVALAGKREMAPFLNAINGNDLKNRIIMMKKKENRNSVIPKLMVIPLTALLISGLSAREYKTLPPSESFGSLSTEQLIEVTNPGKGVGQIIRTKTNEVNPEGRNMVRDTVRIRATGGKDGLQPLYILDGKPVESIEGIAPESIESISVLKDQSSTALYGEKGKNGVILITSKNTGSGIDNSQVSKRKGKNDPMIMLNGKETSQKLSDIAPEDIQSVSILKGEKALSKYGNKGEHGVVEIVLKSGIPSGGKSTSSGGVTTPSSPEEGGITSKEQLASTIAASVKYPVRAREAGMQGEVILYGFVGNNGKISQVTGTKPDGKVIPIDEIVVVGYGPEDEQDDMNRPGVKNSVFTEESSLRIRNLPNLHIPDYKSQWLKFEFRFLLQ